MISAHRQALPGAAPDYHRGRQQARRRTWLAVASAIVAVAAAGCSSSGTGGGGQPSGTGGSPTATMTASPSNSGGGTAAGSPLSAVALASRHITSMSATTTVSTTGANASTVTGTITEQTSPPLAQYTVKTSTGRGSGTIDMVLAGKTIYLKVPSLAAVTHKPWLALKSSAPGGAAAGFAPLIQAFQQDNPVTQSQGLSAATGVHQAGTATIGGVATTEYTGIFNWAAAAARVDPNLRKELGSALTSGAAVHFSVWIDGQHYVRKIVDSTNGPAGHSNVQVLITSINQPVHISVPPASQVGSIPGA